jgi:hypothetical protein
VKRSRLRREVTHISKEIKQDLRIAAQRLRTDTGLPLMCAYAWPDHSAPTTITMRADACLNEGWNGFGFWFVIPAAPGVIPPVSIIAAFDEWTAVEQAALGHNTPAAEALGLLIGHRLCARVQPWTPLHQDLLVLTDSETSAQKFGALRMGSKLMDAIRDAWLQVDASIPLVGVCDYLPRDFNVGADLLSKNRWDLFCATLAEANLPPPTRICIHVNDRDTSALLH